ncbi:MAG: hypothetical protein EOM02_01325 [Synergistales bacterium]|nr:hypothetical protein [Dethiosulfovibrio sp.]NCC95461.1 hypothetical protein [Synergistales bacterium]
MSDFPAFLRSSSAWTDLEERLKGDMPPSALALCLPVAFHREVLLEVAGFLLCNDGSRCGICPSCLGWKDDSHPDMIMASQEGPPSVDQCREMSTELLLKPVLSAGRLGVVPFADGLNLNAANSLLKITEEPPEGCRLIFLMEEDRLIPTLRSRVLTVVFPEKEVFSSVHIPSGRAEWTDWLGRVASLDREGFVREVQGLVTALTDRGLYSKASGLSQLIFLANQTHLSVSMMGDMVFLIIEEEYPFESVFDRVW